MSSGTKQPSDGKGDGTTTTKTDVDVDVEHLSLKELVDYRHDLIEAVCNPGTDYDMTGPQKDVDEAAYKAQLVKVEAQIKSYGDLI